MAHDEWCLRTNETLSRGQWLRSKNGLFCGVMQVDGSFVIYRGDNERAPVNTALWSSAKTDDGFYNPNLGSYHMTMQSDGNLVIYDDASGKAVWSVAMHHDQVMGANRWAVLYDDGNFAVTGQGGAWHDRLWATNVTDDYDADSLELTEIEYNVAAGRAKQNGDPRSVVRSTATNNTDSEQEATVTLTYSKTTATEWGTETTLEIGTTFSASAGIPGVGEAGVEVSSTVTQGFTWNKSESETKEISLEVPVKVPPHQKVKATATWREYSITVPYKAVGTVKFGGLDERIPIHVNGIYEGIANTDVDTQWDPA